MIEFLPTVLAIICAFEGPLVGQKAPELKIARVLQAPDGAKATLESLRGKVVVLEFWTTWCGPCVASIPHLNDLCEKLAGQPIQFISITDEAPGVVESFLKKRVMKSWVALDAEKATFKAYAVHAIPHTVIVNRDGKIMEITSPTDIDERFLRDVIDGKKPSLPERPRTIDKPVVNDEPLFQILIRKTPADNRSCGTTSGRGLLKMYGHPLKSILAEAYDLRESRLNVDGSWAEECYDMTVTTPPDKSEKIHQLMRDALATTFDLSFKRESREMEGYVLTVPQDGKTRLEPSVTAGRSTSERNGQLQAISLNMA